MLLENNDLLVLTGCLFMLSLVTRLIPYTLTHWFERSVTLKKTGGILPGAIMLLLMLHTLDGVKWSEHPHGLPEVGVLLTAVIIFLWRRSLLISLIVGMVLYMCLRQIF